MSDFDKEAERERLREKYEAEEEDREATQHMSELLLKGATMTNSHCGTCGDPIFRHDGQEFCPTCQTQTAAGGDDATAAADDATAQADAQPQTDATAQADARPQTDATAQADAVTPTNARDATTETQGSPRPDRQPVDRRGERDERGTGASTPAPERAGTTTPSAADGQRPTTDAAGGTNARVDADAIANVEATVERFAAAAANTDDPERAREYLATVRDATDTLRALRGNAR